MESVTQVQITVSDNGGGSAISMVNLSVILNETFLEENLHYRYILFKVTYIYTHA